MEGERVFACLGAGRCAASRHSLFFYYPSSPTAKTDNPKMAFAMSTSLSRPALAGRTTTRRVAGRR